MQCCLIIHFSNISRRFPGWVGAHAIQSILLLFIAAARNVDALRFIHQYLRCLDTTVIIARRYWWRVENIKKKKNSPRLHVISLCRTKSKDLNTTVSDIITLSFYALVLLFRPVRTQSRLSISRETHVSAPGSVITPRPSLWHSKGNKKKYPTN